jgi:hypothetical protein
VAASSAFACRARPRARILDLCSSAFRVPSPPGPLSHPRFTPARERGNKRRALRARRHRRGNLEWDGGAPSYQRQRSGRGVVGMRPDVRRMESQDDVGSRDAGLADLPRAL